MDKRVRSRWMRALMVGGALEMGCSSPEAPRSLPRLLVTNSSCGAGHCMTLEIRAFVWKFAIPQVPWGIEVLGDVPPGQKCLTFPSTWTLRVIGPDSSGRIDTTSATWTPNDSVPIYLIAVDSVLFHGHGTQGAADSSNQAIWPYDGFGPGSVGETGNFMPGSAPGWTVAFPSAPGAPFGSANAARSGACQATP